MNVPEAYQRLQPARDQFLIRFYRWAREDSLQEFAQGFPTVKKIRNLAILRLVPFAEQLGEEEKTLLSSALVKRFHPRAVELLEEFPFVKENALLHKYANWDGGPGLGNFLLQKLLLRKLSPVLGNPIEIAANKDILIYQMQLDCWTVRTSIDTGGKRQLGYAHSINARESVSLHDHISILSWIGISSQTDWMYLTEQDTAAVAECLCMLCSRFLATLPKLLEGKSHDIPEPSVREWRAVFTVKGHRKNGYTIVASGMPELRKAFRGRATWEIPTSIIPEWLRGIGSHFVIVQDPSFRRESADPVALSPTYRHVRVELLDK